MRRRTVVLALAAAVLAVGCSSSMEGGKTMAQPSLYERLGGKSSITAEIDDFIGNVAGDTRINRRFANADIPRLKGRLADQVCEATGGPCKYTGASMRDAHTGMKITDAEFGALVEDLVKSLDKFKVPEKEKGELLGVLGPMKADIVTQ